MNLMDLFIKIGVDDQASGNIEKITGKIGSGLATAAKVGAAAVGAAAAGIAALTKASVDQYAEYEQLVGGVETLFKDSSNTVMQYAKNAYKTAGMSANEYMSTVTSFSASLIGSLATTTEKAVGAVTEETIEALKNQLDATKESQEEQVEALEKANDKKLSLIQKANEKEISDFERLTDEKIALIDKQYQENLKLINEEEYNRIKAIEDQIKSLNAETEAEEKAAEKEEQARKKAELEKKISSAESIEERKKAEQNLADYIADLARKEAKEARALQIENLKEQKAAIKEEASAKKDALKESRDAQVKEVKDTSAEQLKALKEGQKEQLEAIKESQKEELEALKKSNKNKLKQMKEFIKEQEKLVTDGTVQVKAYSDEVYAQAAEYADLAIRDMSDNANKMGTSMEMIQNAYQGFAKQNYTMLDNLKLGYGGTKTEMERLIKDASALDSSIDANSMSFDNIVKAIHAVQDEMGITGTTALEAGRTISGSVGAMRAAWQNLATGLADENANIDELLNAFLSSVGNVATNIVPVIKRIVTSIVNTLIENGPELLAQGTLMLAEFVLGLINGIPDMVARIPEIIEAIVTAFSERGDEFKDVGLQIVQGICEGIWEGIKGAGGWLLDKIGGFFSGIVDSAKETLGIHSPSRVFADIGKNMALGVGEGWNDEFKGVKGNINGSVVQGWKKTEGKTYGLNASQNPVNIVIETVLDGAVLARKTYKHNQTESMLRGNSLVEGVV